jgi:hypothetical protein
MLSLAGGRMAIVVKEGELRYQTPAEPARLDRSSASELALPGTFPGTYAAYESLPEKEKKAIEGLKAAHRVEAGLRPA